ncbi:DUF72 domain-containing protein [Streptomyces johnsoniae]|uniref:DUF72 domain-containing protein n=1 Tax=Streptomyces johnsoniae TaxID=3075532 RepID=A0ABU2S047_9ACTN|nr:DUF72 domain-containing protein [Streptomyces sp. DSM 41886]MDT0442363.1 DUF72 domain-containing protein [Streptomyces sp. DSM 41886]
MGDILIGTCSWTDRALVAGGWYPPGHRGPEGRLRYYAARFPVVEVDATYYALPTAQRSRQWAQRTPDGFVFDVKAYSLLTGHPTRAGTLPLALRPPGPAGRPVRGNDLGPAAVRDTWAAFLDGIEPLRRAGRLGSVLLQFPPWFAPGRGARARLARARELAGDVPLTAEFRHADWLRPPQRADTLALLREHDMALGAVDTAQGLPSSLPPVAEVTCPGLSVVRFHGRSAAWGTGSKEDRFRHRYVREELLPWLPRIEQLAERADAVHVLFNNCCADAAVSAAALMRTLVAQRVNLG